MVCGKRFNEKGNLKAHQIFHSAERPFKCKYCEKTYKTNCHLKEHIEINHLNIKKFKCSICKFSFGRHSTLLIHSRTHGKKNIEDNPYQRIKFLIISIIQMNLLSIIIVIVILTLVMLI